MSSPRWAGARHLRPRTVRLRLTALYGALFLIGGAALLTITYLLVQHSSDKVLTYRSPDGRSVAEINVPAKPPVVGEGKVQTPNGVKTLSPQQMLAQANRMRRLAEQQHADTMHSLLLDSGIALAGMTVLSIGLGWVVAGRVLRPLRTMTNAVREISATNLHRRLAMRGPRDELTELGNTFDGLLGRLETAFQAQRRFVANASHELRTPLARQRAIGQVALADPDATAESLRAAHERVLAAGAQQERLIAALLALARGQSGVLHSEAVDLAELLRRVLAGHELEAAAREIHVDAALTHAPVLGDPRLLEMLVVNLVENALRHNLPGGRMTTSTRTDGAQVTLRVGNSGSVVPADEVERLLLPFHRLSPDRTAHGDGLGIGLSIVQAVTSAHDAALVVRPRPGGGLTVEITFDAAPGGNAALPAAAAIEENAIVAH
ncbi:MAG TPA: ATP-binding protein [Jatrophihabitans sp.]|jgi:signal transduction histidine kinase|nr:ATP-binding protein [Jatrophihabitans sp.]